MAHHAHVPKFGDWDNNATYTACFDMASKGKNAGLRTFNPNDPVQNPEAFMPGKHTQGQQHNRRPRDGSSGDYHAARNNQKKHHGGERNEFQVYAGAPAPHKHTPHRDDRDARSGNRRSSVPEFTSDKSYYDDPPVQFQHHSRPSRSSVDGSHGFRPPAPHQAIPKAGNFQQGEALHRRGGSSVPKFGAWDVGDSNSGEGYTLIFDKVKEEKHKPGIKLPPTSPPEPIVHPEGQRNYRNEPNDSSRNKMFCCLCPAVKE